VSERSMASLLEPVRLPVRTRLCAAASRLGVGDEALVMIDQAVVSASNFALVACVARILPIADFGLYMLVMSMVWMFVDLQVATIAAPYVINRQKLSNWKRAAFFGSVVLHEGVVLAAAMLISAVVIVAINVEPTDAEVGGTRAGIAALAVGALLLRDQTRRFFIAHGKLRDCLVFDGFVVALHGAGIFAGVASQNFSLIWAFGASAFACAVPCALWLSRLGSLHVRTSLAFKHWRLNWSLGRWMVLSGMMWSLATYIYPWTLSAMRGTTDTGIWAAALGLCSLCNVPLSGLQNHYAVRIAGSDIWNLGQKIIATAVRLAGIAAAFVVLFAVAGDRIIVLLYGEAFEVAAPLTVLMALNLLVGAVSFCVSRGLFSLDRGGADCAVNAIPLAAFGVGGALATAQFGPTGAVLSFLVSNVLALGVRILVLRSVLHTKRSSSMRLP